MQAIAHKSGGRHGSAHLGRVDHQGGIERLLAGLGGVRVSGSCSGLNLDEVVSEVERRLILQALERSGGVRTTAAKLLGVTNRSLRYRLQKLSLATDEDVESSSDIVATTATTDEIRPDTTRK